MAELVIDGSGVLAGTGGAVEQGVAGETVTAGQVVYQDGATKTYKLADGTTAVKAAAKGVSTHAAATGQPLRVQTGGAIDMGAPAHLTVGQIYVVGATPGSIAPIADLVATNVQTVLGIATSDQVLTLRLWLTGLAKP